MHVDYQGRITLDAAKRAYQHHIAITNEACPILIVGQSVVAVDREAERYASSPEIVRITRAMAIVTNSSLQKHLARMFFWYRKPPYPIQVFATEEEAVEWLQQY